MQRKKIRIGWTLAVVALCCTAVAGRVMTQQDAAAPEPSADQVKADPPQLMLYFAALEGLHRDNVDEEVLKVLRQMGQDGTPLHFVKGCPVCIPVQQAFFAFRGVPYLGSRKGEETAVTGSLPKTVREALLSDQFAVRLNALEKLVAKWVRDDMARRRMTDAEREAYRNWMMVGRKEGMGQLMGMIQSGMRQEWRGIKRCAVCDGGNLPF